MPLSDEIIRNCTWGFACEKRFEDMAPTAFEDVRHCGFCQKAVHFCDTDEKLAYAVRQGWCVAIEARRLPHEEDDGEANGPYDLQHFRLTSGWITSVRPAQSDMPYSFRDMARANPAFSTPPNGYEQADWADASPLALLGYSVGRKGLSRNKRRALLEAFFDADLPQEYPEVYRERWGVRTSETRLEAMCNHLRWLARQAAMRSNAEAMAVAISDWEDDALFVETSLAQG